MLDLITDFLYAMLAACVVFRAAMIGQGAIEVRGNWAADRAVCVTHSMADAPCNQAPYDPWLGFQQWDRCHGFAVCVGTRGAP